MLATSWSTQGGTNDVPRAAWRTWSFTTSVNSTGADRKAAGEFAATLGLAGRCRPGNGPVVIMLDHDGAASAPGGRVDLVRRCGHQLSPGAPSRIGACRGKLGRCWNRWPSGCGADLQEVDVRQP